MIKMHGTFRQKNRHNIQYGTADSKEKHMQNEETPNVSEPVEKIKKTSKKRPPEKRLFHQPVTPV